MCVCVCVCVLKLIGVSMRIFNRQNIHKNSREREREIPEIIVVGLSVKNSVEPRLGNLMAI